MSKPEWNDTDGILRWIDENEHTLDDRYMNRVDTEVAEANQTVANTTFPSLTMYRAEQTALLALLGESGKRNPKPVADILRDHCPSPGFRSVLAEVLEFNLLHGPAIAGALQTSSSARVAVRQRYYTVRAGLRVLFANRDDGLSSTRASEIVSAEIGKTPTFVIRCAERPDEAQENRRSLRDLILMVRMAALL